MTLRQTLTASFFGGALAAVLAGTALAAPQINQPAPDFTAQTANGETLELASLRGQVVVLEWTNHDCPFVRKHYESANMQSLQKEAIAKDVVWLQVISSAPGKQGHVDGPTAVQLNEERGAAATQTLLDPSGEIGQLYGAQTTPHMYIIDPEGTLVYMGGIDSIPSRDAADIPQAVNYVREALAAVESGQPVPNAVTRPYGCAVHYGS